jgi:hypothetical protein
MVLVAGDAGWARAGCSPSWPTRRGAEGRRCWSAGAWRSATSACHVPLITALRGFAEADNHELLAAAARGRPGLDVVSLLGWSTR